MADRHRTGPPNDLSETSSSSSESDQTAEDTWPWACLDCGTPIYHDGDWCADCKPTVHRADATHVSESSTGFTAWMRRESVTTFTAKVATIAGIELLLTTFWLRQLLPRIAKAGSVFPFVL